MDKRFIMACIPVTPLAPLLPAIVRLRFLLKPETALHFNDFPGSTLRGALGLGLKDQLCMTDRDWCDECPLITSCRYPIMLDGYRPSGSGHSSQEQLRHWLLDVSHLKSDYQPGELIEVGLSLFGESLALLADLPSAWQQAGSYGLGKNRVTFSLAGMKVENGLGSNHWVNLAELKKLEPLAIPMGPEQQQCSIQLLSPFRSKFRGKLMDQTRFDAPHFINVLARRLDTLSGRDGKSEDSWLSRVSGAAVTVDQLDLDWADWARYSNRQKSALRLGGLVGSFSLASPQMTQIWPLLWAGQWFGAGKQTTFGLGQFRLSD